MNPREGPTRVLLDKWKKGQLKLENFWQIWLLENLPALRERHTLQMKRIKGEITRRLEVGEVVIVKEENIPRGSRKLAKIQYLIKGPVDGIERAAKLISPFGEEFRRPLRLVYPLESRNEEAGDEVTGRNEET